MQNGVPQCACPIRTDTHLRASRTTPRSDRNAGGPHDHVDAVHDIDDGKMDGFIKQAHSGQSSSPASEHSGARLLAPGGCGVDVMGYHDQREIPNYWTYAKNFVLQDHMFESDTSWSLPAHLYMVSGWSAHCSKKGDPMSCSPAIQAPGSPPAQPPEHDRRGPRLRVDGPHLPASQASRELALLRLQRHPARLRRRRDVLQGGAAEREDAGHLEPAAVLRHGACRIDQLGDVAPLRDFLAAAKAGTLPSVSWITPTQKVSDHPPALISDGQTYVTGLIDRIMRSPTGARPRSSSRGTTGAASTTTSSRRRSMRRAMACGSRRS